MNGLNIERIYEDMFRINKYNFTRVPFVDVVTTSAPYFHFQILFFSFIRLAVIVSCWMLKLPSFVRYSTNWCKVYSFT